MSVAERIMSQWGVTIGTPPDHKECWGAWLELVCLSIRYKSIVEGMERRQTAERWCKILVISSVLSLACGWYEWDGQGQVGSIPLRRLLSVSKDILILSLVVFEMLWQLLVVLRQLFKNLFWVVRLHGLS